MKDFGNGCQKKTFIWAFQHFLWLANFAFFDKREGSGIFLATNSITITLNDSPANQEKVQIKTYRQEKFQNLVMNFYF